jgi:formylglycine-generating enzyme required for sulfatase activity
VVVLPLGKVAEMACFRFLSAMFVVLLGFVGAATAAEIFKDCSNCPAMVQVPAGTFVMGSSTAESAREGKYVADERPQHTVTIAKAFAIGQFTVTRGEFADFVRDTGHDPHGCYVYARGKWFIDPRLSWRNPGYVQSDRHPVVCVSREDAQDYAKWLSGKTGHSYRLPTEAEWEYSARGGTTTARFWGDGRERACEYSNVADLTGAAVLHWNMANINQVFQCNDGYAFTAPVGSFSPNAFGLYDMLGNVFQWTEDCYHDSYSGAPSDGSAWTGGCKDYVQRGGSWSAKPSSVRSADRNGGPPVDRNIDIGFRVVRAIAP